MLAKSKILFLLCAILVLPTAMAGTVERAFSDNNVPPLEIITVSLNVEIEGASVYSISELIPTGWTVTNVVEPGILLSSGNEIRWFVFNPSGDQTLQYSVRACSQSGSHFYNGTAIFNNNRAQNIAGETQVVVSGTVSNSGVKINEFVVDPQNDWDGVGSVSSSDEWFELYNSGTTPVDLNGWTLQLLDSTNEIEELSGVIPAGGYSVILNPMGQQNNDGRIILIDELGEEIDSLTYGNFDDGNVSDNAPDGNADSNTNECLTRTPNGIDTDNDASDFIKAECTFGASNSEDEDNIPPIISNVQTSPSTTSALISWNTNEEANSTVLFGLTGTLGSEESESGFVMAHTVSLSGLISNTQYFYKVKSCDIAGNCAESNLNSFTTTETQQEMPDDLMVNYIRGMITINNQSAPAGTEYNIEVLNGENVGFIFHGFVDSNIPAQLQGEGFYYSLDQVEFSTGAGFRVALEGECEGVGQESVFVNGGNGNFNNGNGLINLV